MKFLKLIFCFILFGFYANAQTNPQPYFIANGEYRFEGYEDINISEFPASMVGWTGAHGKTDQPGNPPTNVIAKGDMGLTPTDNGADLGNLFKNHGLKGISLRGLDTLDGGSLAIGMALNTVGATGVKVTWKANPIHAFVNNVSGLALQYRVGVTGDWKNLPDNEYVMSPDKAPAGQTQLEGEVFGPTTLPAECDGKEVVQLRWMTYFILPGPLDRQDNRAAVDSVVIVATTATPQAPQADFSSDKQKYNLGEITQFNDLTGGAPNKWFWDFGDQGVDSVQNPSHTYITPGVYTVKLIATNSVASDTATKVDYITVVDPTQGIVKFSNAQLKFSPNPSSNFISLSGINNSKNEFSIIDINGKTIMSISGVRENQRINIESLAKGIYILELRDSEGIFQNKLLKN